MKRDVQRVKVSAECAEQVLDVCREMRADHQSENVMIGRLANHSAFQTIVRRLRILSTAIIPADGSMVCADPVKIMKL